MDLSTGEIKAMEEAAKSSHPFIPIDLNDATEKQRRENRVSLHDHRSTLGEKLTAERSKRGMTKNQLRKLRRKGKLK